MKKKLFLVDGMAMAYRAHFAFINSRLRNSEGIMTGPVYGFANQLERLLEEHKPSHIAVAWDTHAPTFRHEKDPQYKANRPPQPEDLRTGIPLIKEMIEYYGIQNIEKDGFEADDLIGTIVNRAQIEHVDAYMVTPDKDFMQLVKDHILMLKPDNQNGGMILIDREGVLDYFQVYPEQVVDVLAIIGDASDNIPGVPGIGKKGAPKVIEEFGTLENAIENAASIKAKRVREGLMNFSEQALHAKEMVTIQTDVEDVPDWHHFDWHGSDDEKLGLFFQRMEFRTLTRKYLGEDAGVGTGSSRGIDSKIVSNSRSVEGARGGGQQSLFGDSGGGGLNVNEGSGGKSGGGKSGGVAKSGSNGNPGGGVNPGDSDNPGSHNPPPPAQRNPDSVHYHMVTTLEDLEKHLKTLSADAAKSGTLSFDTETNSTDPIYARAVGVSLAARPGTAIYIPLDIADDTTKRATGTGGKASSHEQGSDQSTRGLNPKYVNQKLQPLFNNPNILKIAHNLKFDWLILHRLGLTIQGPLFDTMVAAYLHDAGQKLTMDAISIRYLNYRPIPITDLIGFGKSEKNMEDLAPEEITDYACEDADITLQLAASLRKKLEEDGLMEIATELEFPLIPVLARMELQGIKIDMDRLQAFASELRKDLIALQETIFQKTGTDFNLNSPQQLGDVLFNKMGLPSGKKTKTGQYSTSEAVLQELANEYEVPSLILDYRSLAKLLSTYVEALPKLADPETHRIHTSFNQTIAATGRLSSSNPNLQNIPIRTERGREIRKAFIPEEGFMLVSADYSQVELRVIASIANATQMIQAFEDGEDIHARTAMEIFGLDSLEDVTPDQRRKAKEVNFGIPYGVSAYGLASRLGIPNKEGKQMIERYFERFPGVQTYMTSTIEEARDKQYVTTLMGRRRYIPDIQSGNWNARGFAERTAINMPIQGTAADIIKKAMIEIDELLQREGCRSRMLLQVHDELVFEVAHDEVEELVPKIRGLMEQAFELSVPLEVEVGVADNWLDAH
jgi:DNA polymerase-1